MLNSPKEALADLRRQERTLFFRELGNQVGNRIGSLFKRAAVPATFSSILERRDQLLALMLVPFFIVAAIGFAVVLHEVILEFLPDAASNIQAVIFLSGTVLVIAVVVATFMWVKSGGFGIFAE